MQEVIIITYATVEGVWLIAGQTTKRGPALFWLMFMMIGGKTKVVTKHDNETYFSITNEKGEKVESFEKSDLKK